MIREPIVVPPQFATVDDVAAGLAALERSLLATRDLRGLFVMTYIVTTSTIQRWIDRGVFLDNDAMARYVVAFGNAFRKALADRIAGEHARVSPAWQQCFDACDERRESALQCLMLGINAHINRDLPYAVIDAGVDVNCSRCYRDYARIDEVMRLSIPLVRQRISRAYRTELSLGERWFGHVIDGKVVRAVERARLHSWTLARLLADADTEAARARVDHIIERRAATVGQRILRHKSAPASCVAALHDVELPFTSDERLVKASFG